MGGMSPNKRRAVGVVVLGLGALALAVRMTRPRYATLPPLPPRVPQSDLGYVHPVVPSVPVVNPPPPTCRARDLHDVARATRQTEKHVAADIGVRGQKKGAPAGCRAAAEDRALLAEVDVLARVTSGCVARDATLDSQWNLVQSAAVALDACADCTRPREDRTVSCTRAIELVAAAEKATP
jgi:hypothetical protein